MLGFFLWNVGFDWFLWGMFFCGMSVICYVDDIFFIVCGGFMMVVNLVLVGGFLVVNRIYCLGLMVVLYKIEVVFFYGLR